MDYGLKGSWGCRVKAGGNWDAFAPLSDHGQWEERGCSVSVGYLSSYLRLQNKVLWGPGPVKYTTSSTGKPPLSPRTQWCFCICLMLETPKLLIFYQLSLTSTEGGRNLKQRPEVATWSATGL